VKTFGDQTFYEILKISEDAVSREIKQAYREALDLYEEESLATYALFSDEQRAELLDAIEEAYFTLSDPDRRNAYDLKVIGTASRVADQPIPSDTEEDPAAEPPPPPPKTKDLNAWVRRRLKEEKCGSLADEIVSKDLISGNDLKRLRQALDIELADIYQATRISNSTLTMIEENRFENLPADVFLKSFLKSYAEILQVDSHRVVEGYYRYMNLADQSDL